jgi:hypothetical protein
LARDGIDSDVRNPGRAICDSNRADINAFHNQRGQGQVTKHVLTNRADQVCRRASTCRCDGLIRALPAEH